MKQIRQGDVLLVPVKQLPEHVRPVAPEAGRVVLAHGEVTGHAHSVDAAVARLFAVSGVEDRFLRVETATAVTHEEHDALPLDPGLYRVVRQREYDDEDEVRRVAD